MAAAVARAALLLHLLLQASPTTALVANPPHFPHDTEFTVRRMLLEDYTPMQPPESETPLRVTDHVIRLKRQDSVSVSSIYVQAMRKQAWARTERDMRLGVSCP